MIIVTGATGKLGGAIVEKLRQKIPASGIGISVRDPKKAEHLAAQGTRVRPGDFSDPKSLYHSFEGAETVLIISANNVEHGVKYNGNAIDAAVKCGAKRILYTSHMAASASSLFSPMLTHAATEVKLKAAGIEFTSLRNGFYTDTTMRFIAPALESGEILAPEDGPVSWTTHADLADVAVAALIQGGTLKGITPPLTGAEALDLNAIAKIMSKILGKEIKRVTVSDEAFKKSLLARGLPDSMINISLGMFKASRRGEFAAVDPTLEKVIGHKSTSMLDFLSDQIG